MVLLCGGPDGTDIVLLILLVLIIVLIFWYVKGADERKIDKEIRMTKKTIELKNMKKHLEE